MAEKCHRGSPCGPPGDSQSRRKAISESPVAQNRPSGPIRNHKILESSADQPQNVGASPGHDNNKRCNVQETFPPSPVDLEPLWPVVRTKEEGGDYSEQ